MILKDKVVVVTGGAGLIGRGFIEAIIRHGGIGIIADIDLAAAEAAKNTIYQNLKDEYLNVDSIFCIELDITSKASLESAITTLHSHFGKIDALVNNAYPRTAMWGKKNFLKWSMMIFVRI